ncbi:hypothetical protein [Chitinophaga sancti]|uniref:DUF4142 domain-containing protein n=1 Tax=Chitinophaga sancti TaxID=1004 RepID=A0A1K1S7N7_9BACT|nr:hypothetical protein [Chitinophaga sancti]WQD62178.1 hypothetical protein U0033_30270 [Chitinophaga sancti]WQG92253.1 hypothetical protein SR876_12115 [Chitinophaga sancti]SFW80076.1 hypothetical protein SAMN05661012_04894 [Chitinophaga sancti]
MKKLFLILAVAAILPACTNPSPENYFDTAVLNTNMINDFGSDALTKMLIAQNVKYNGTLPNGPNAATKMIDGKVQYIESTIKKVKDLKETSETKTMLRTSEALFEYVLPVYKNEYTALAKMSDEGGTKEDVLSLGKEIDEKYGARFDSLFEVLTSEGKRYAAAHDIKVNWGN